PEVTKDPAQPSTENVQPPDVQPQARTSEPVNAPKPKQNIPYPSRLTNQKLRERDDHQMKKFLQIFRSLHFDISFSDALLYMPKFASTFKNLLSHKEKLFEVATNTLVNDNCSAVILKKLPEKLGDPDRSTTRPTDITKDVFMRVGKFHFLADFVVVDYDVDPRVPLIIGRPFLRTARALIDVYGEELTLRVGDEAITFKVGNTSKFSYNDAESINRIDVIDVALEEYPQEVLGFSRNSESGNPTPASEPIIARSSPSLTPFEGGDIILEEIESHDSVPQDIDSEDISKFFSTFPIPMENCGFFFKKSERFTSVPEFETFRFDLEEENTDVSFPGYECFYSEGDIRLFEKFLNEDPSSPLPPKEIKTEELKSGTNKLPIIIAKDLKKDEKERLIKVLKSHKHAIAWKLSDIKGIDLQFCTHKILIEEDFKLAVQHQRRVNPKIHEVIKKEVVKLFDAGLIYPISDSPWVCPVHCVPKKGGMTVVTNEDNELIPTRLVTGCRVCIDYRKLNEATRKEHFLLPFIDQMLERLTGNEYYCFLDGFSGCMMAIFHDMIEETMEVFMDDFSVFEDSFSSCLSHLDKMLKRKGAKNLAADHLSRLENPHQNDPEKKEITETFPLETLGMPLISSRLATMDPPRDIMVPTTSLRKSLIPVSIGRQFIEIPKTWSHGVILVNVKAKSRSVMRCLKTQFKFARSLTYRASTLWARSRLLEGTSTFSWPLTTCQNGLKRKRSLLMTPELFVMLKYGLTHRLSTVYHPQTSRQVEVLNCGLKRILERTVGENRASWSDKLDDALWAFRTVFKIPIGCTPYKLVYGKACHLPIELEHKAYWALKHCNFYLKTAGDHRKVQTNELNELRDQAYENSLIYKEKTKKIHHSKIKNRIFNVGDRVLIFNSRLKIFSGKLKTRWTRPFTVAQVFHYSTIELSSTNGPKFKVNGHRLKHYFGGDIPTVVVSDLQTFPMDN
nr:reverse transcriptase domain-containing protein [Tanacetum cinerariifolium]